MFILILFSEPSDEPACAFRFLVAVAVAIATRVEGW